MKFSVCIPNYNYARFLGRTIQSVLDQEGVDLEVVVSDDKLQMVMDTIIAAGQTGQVGDGKMFVSELTEVVRIRTGESGEGAI